MKKTILAALMVVMIATPCLAQEVEPEGMFSVDGTLWGSCEIEITSYAPFFSMNCDKELWFYQGRIYSCKYHLGCEVTGSYIDLGVVSIAWYIYPPNYYLAIMQPSIGFGVYTEFDWYRDIIYRPYYEYKIGIMYKVDDDWIPPNFSLSINPNSGYQGTTLTNVHLYANNTTFQDNPPVQIGIESPYGLAVSNINVISNTEIEFDLDIAIDAPVGLRTVIVTYYYGPHLRPLLRVGTAEFEVFEKAL